MPKQVISTDKAPAAIGPYSQAVVANGFVFASGQIPINPATGEIVTESIEAQTHQVLSNVKALLNAAGADMKDAVKVTVFIKDMNNFNVVNGIYGEYFVQPYPARSFVEVAALPRNVGIEIEVIALIPER